MTGIYEMWETEDLLETGGVWIDYGKDAGEFLIARAGGSNSKFGQVLEARMRPHRRQMDNNKMDPDIADKVLRETFVDSCLLDWKGVKDRDGKELKFNRANALKLFIDLPDLFTDLREQSQKMATYQAKVDEDDAGN